MTERSLTKPSGWNSFWFTPIPAAALHRMRLLTGLVLCGWMLGFAGSQQAFFSLDGWFDRLAYAEINRSDSPSPVPIGWSIFFLAGDNRGLFDMLYWGSFAIVALFTLGVATRLTGILTWVVTASLLANPASSYDADFLLGILAFYMMIGYTLLGLWSMWTPPVWKGWRQPLEYAFGPSDAFVLSPWLGGRRDCPAPLSYAANVTLRLIQIHFAIIIVTSGLHKLQLADWWAGVALWYPMHPPLKTTADQLTQERGTAAVTLGFLSLIQYLGLAWQIGFPAFAWRRGYWRVVLIGGAAIGWLTCFFVLGLPLFGPIYLIACLSFLGEDEWQRVRGWFGNRSAGAAKPARVAAESNRIKVGSN